MSRAFPFLRPPEDIVEAGPWSRAVGTGTEELPATLPEWDYDTVLTLGRPVTVDGLRARTLSGLDEGAEIDLTVRWSASSSALRGRAWQAAVPPRDGVELPIEFELPGAELGGSLSLDLILTLRRATPTSSVAAPRRPGSILWSDRFSTVLQGDAVLFPLAVADFHELPFPEKAGWYLEVGQDLDAAALGSILLLANEKRDVVVNALETASDPSEGARRVLSALRTDVLRALVERALTDDNFIDGHDYPTGSLGGLLASVLRTNFPGSSFEALRRERNFEPMLFASRIQDASDLLAAP
jgi:hypothetical protein